MPLPKVKFTEIVGQTYEETWKLQKSLLAKLIDNKMKWRELSPDEKAHKRQIHHLIFCEHAPVYTLGKSGSENHLLLSEKHLRDRGIEYFKINRGGDITFHGPGQITGYLIFDLEEFFTDVHRFVRTIEEVIIKTLGHFGVQGERIQGYTGVWIKGKNSTEKDRKICAIGVHLSRWVSMHGFALNVNTDLKYFENIVPCGISDKDKDVTSLEKELGHPINFSEVKNVLKNELQTEFNFDWKQ